MKEYFVEFGMWFYLSSGWFPVYANSPLEAVEKFAIENNLSNKTKCTVQGCKDRFEVVTKPQVTVKIL